MSGNGSRLLPEPGFKSDSARVSVLHSLFLHVRQGLATPEEAYSAAADLIRTGYLSEEYVQAVRRVEKAMAMRPDGYPKKHTAETGRER